MAAMGNGDEIDSEVIDSHDDDDDDESSDGDGLDNSSDDDDDDVSYDSINADGWPVIPPIINTVEKFIRTFHKGYYDAEFDNALRLDRNVIPPARPTQASYNKPDNWIERNRIGLEKVKRQLQNLVGSVTLCENFRLILRQNSQRDQLVDTEEQIVWHEPVLQDILDQLKTEIDRRKQLGIVTKIDDIDIENIEMTKEHLTTLVAISSATNSSICLHFDNANICEEGIISLAKLVEVSLELEYFCLYHNRIDNMDSARSLSRSLKSHTCVNELHLHHCDLGSSPEILLVILQSDVEYITLDNNNIDSLGAV